MSLSTLFKYYKLKEKLPKPDGSLSQCIPSSSIVNANEELAKFRNFADGNDVSCVTAGKRGAYSKLSTAVRAKIAAENGVAATIRHFCITGEYPNLKESSVRTWRNTYTAELERKRKMRDDNMDIEELPKKRRGDYLH